MIELVILLFVSYFLLAIVVGHILNQEGED